MFKGGYQIINFKGEDLSTATVIPGAFNAVKSAVEAHKPILLQNIAGMISGYSYAARYDSNDNYYVLPVLGVDSSDKIQLLILTVQSNDECLIDLGV